MTAEPYSALYRRNRPKALARAGGRCEWPDCHRLATTVDHITPRVLGGGDGLDNLRASCGPHNYAGGARITNARRSKVRGQSRPW